MPKKKKPNPADALPGLLGKVIQGEKFAEERFWEQMRLTVHMYSVTNCRKLSIKPENADDIGHESLIKVINKFDTLIEIENLGAWLSRITYNEAINFIRKQKNRNLEVSLDQPFNGSDDETNTLLNYIVMEDRDVYNKVEARNILSLAQEIILTVSKEKQDVYRLYIQGYTQKEIAEETSLPRTTVNNHIKRTKDIINERIKEIFETDSNSFNRGN